MSEYCNVANVLDTALSLVQDNSAANRARFLTWLGLVVRNVVESKQNLPWGFLKKSASLAITAMAVTKPTDYDRLKLATIGDMRLSTKHLLSEEEAEAIYDATATEPSGYTEDATTITFYPGATGTCDLSYFRTIPAIADNTDATIFPASMLELLVHGVLSYYFLFDGDPNAAASGAVYDALLKKAKARDNKAEHPLPQFNRNGYRR